MNLAESARIAEALLFSSARPMTLEEIAEALPEGADVAAAVETLEAAYGQRGIRLVRSGGGICFRTAPESSALASSSVRPPLKLTRATMETLAAVACFQPVTRSEIERVRGVSIGSGIMDALLWAGYVRPGRRRDGPGRPLTWCTTETFLDHFDLNAIEDMPEFRQMREAGLLKLAAAPDGIAPQSTEAAEETTA
jgi:segregation and condensation protein B